jgi:hypothetical protein
MRIGDGDAYTAILMALADAPAWIDSIAIFRRGPDSLLLAYDVVARPSGNSYGDSSVYLIRIEADMPVDLVEHEIQRFFAGIPEPPARVSPAPLPG